MSILDDVSRYYREQGISSVVQPFQCRHLSDCKRNSPGFVESREPYIGREYEKCGTGLMPRLLFISLDPGQECAASDKRTCVAQQAYEEEDCNHSELPQNSHWYQTHELAWRLLRNFDATVSLGSACRYFAHTNSAKCCMNKLHNRQADGQLFKNCREYIPGEIEVLAPNILVT
jgi:hypothetical protein